MEYASQSIFSKTDALRTESDSFQRKVEDSNKTKKMPLHNQAGSFIIVVSLNPPGTSWVKLSTVKAWIIRDLTSKTCQFDHHCFHYRNKWLLWASIGEVRELSCPCPFPPLPPLLFIPLPKAKETKHTTYSAFACITVGVKHLFKVDVKIPTLSSWHISQERES